MSSAKIKVLIELLAGLVLTVLGMVVSSILSTCTKKTVYTPEEAYRAACACGYGGTYDDFLAAGEKKGLTEGMVRPFWVQWNCLQSYSSAAGKRKEKSAGEVSW